MRPGGGNVKGSNFERLICRKLTKWITGEEKPEIFWRSASSGAKATQDWKKGQKSIQHGDIVAIDEKGQWLTDKVIIEIKDRKDFRIEHWLEQRGEFLKWWEQGSEDADRAGKLPVLIFKRLHSHIYIAYKQDDLGELTVRIQLMDDGINILELDYWMDVVTPKMLKGWLNQ